MAQDKRASPPNGVRNSLRAMTNNFVKPAAGFHSAVDEALGGGGRL